MHNENTEANTEINEVECSKGDLHKSTFVGSAALKLTLATLAGATCTSNSIPSLTRQYVVSSPSHSMHHRFLKQEFSPESL